MKKILLKAVIILVVLLVLIYIIYLIAAKKVQAPTTPPTRFQGPPPGSVPYVKGPPGPPPTMNISP